MSMISEQVKKIRSVAGICTIEVKKTLLEAADTIEALSAKLQAANMENGGGWIACEDRLPEKESAYITTRTVRDIWTNERLREEIEIVAFLNKNWIQKPQYEVIAWQPLPEPYRP